MGRAMNPKSEMNTDVMPERQHDWVAIKRFVIFLCLSFLVFSTIGWFYGQILLPFGVSLFFAYLVVPIVDWLERNRINRGLASFLILTLFLAVISLTIFRLGPFLYDQLVGLVHQVPSLVDSLAKNAATLVRGWMKDLGVKDTAGVERALRGFNFMEKIMGSAQAAAEGLWATSANIMGSIVSVVLVPLMTFFLVLEKPRLFQSMRRVVPRDVRPYIGNLARGLDGTIKAVVQGHVKVAAALAALYSIGFVAVGLDAGIAIGIVAGLCRVIPYLDVFVGILFGTTYIFTTGLPPSTVFALLGVIGVVQVLDGVFITPKLIGGKVGLHPVIVILTILAACSHMGFWGVLIAIPLAASVKTIYKMVLPVYRDSRWFRRM